MRILTELCSLPTAPFMEQHIVDYVERFVERRRRLKLSRDRFGNLLLVLPGRTKKRQQPRLVFTAHMDHPGFIAREMNADGLLEADFFGGVQIDYFKGAKVRFFDGRREVRGVVQSVTKRAEGRDPMRARIKIGGMVAPGSIGMWDIGAGRVRGKRFLSRVCDDLAGAAAALAMLDVLVKDPPTSTVAVLLTRAEEVGFIGAIAAAKHPRLLRKSDRLIAIECSSEQPYAPQGKGVIIRVGDRASVFHSGLTYFLSQQAEALAKEDKRFQYQRALMPGGVCEATAYDAYGFTAAAVCVALGNYHNMDKRRKRIAPEYVSVADWQNMVKLFVRVAKRGEEYAGKKPLRDRCERMFKQYQGLL